MKQKIKKKNALLWLFEPLEEDPRFVRRKFFNLDAAYLDGLLYAAVGAAREPWPGLLICTSREHHVALVSEFPQLAPHSVLGKWLYISQLHPSFESVATEIVTSALRRDPRLGVVSAPQRVRLR